MHTYRDAIWDVDDQHVVQYAAVLYPGATQTYDDDVAAIRAYPGEADAGFRCNGGCRSVAQRKTGLNYLAPFSRILGLARRDSSLLMARCRVSEVLEFRNPDPRPTVSLC